MVRVTSGNLWICIFVLVSVHEYTVTVHVCFPADSGVNALIAELAQTLLSMPGLVVQANHHVISLFLLLHIQNKKVCNAAQMFHYYLDDPAQFSSNLVFPCRCETASPPLLWFEM